MAATEGGGTTEPGLQRVDVNKKLTGCRTVWRSNVRAPSVVPKVSARSGLLYTYTKPPAGTNDPWYLTALDFDNGKTRWKRLAGEGLGFNNNYAPDHDRPERRGSTWVSSADWSRSSLRPIVAVWTCLLESA